MRILLYLHRWALSVYRAGFSCFTFDFDDSVWCARINWRVILQCQSVDGEGRKTIQNSLTLIMAIGILTLIIINMVNPTQFFPEYLHPLFGGASLVVIYVFLHMFNFLTAYGLNQWSRPKRNQDFIIVLGSGLINDRVPPLLASRIDKAIEFYHQQKKVTVPPKIIFSGGQGQDEGLPEAEAMQNYAVEKGIPVEDTIQEDKSVSTYENMRFSKRIMDNLSGEGTYQSIFATNNFHLFRAGIYARKAGLASRGIGSKTAFYYWPNAMVREYIAVVVMGRRRHFMAVSFIMGFAVLLSIISYFLTSRKYFIIKEIQTSQIL